MATPRYKLIDPQNLGFYHIVTRTVRQAWLCGYDKKTKKNYNHRKQWIKDRISELAPNFSLNIHAFAIMSNHFHMVIEYDPNAARSWSNKETAERWYNVYPPKLKNGEIDCGLREFLIENMLDDPKLLAKAREDLSSVGLFMQLLKQPIARRANLEDGCTGHFFEKRYYSGALLSETAILASMAYVDLNPIRAKITKHLDKSEATSIQERLDEAYGHAEALEAYLEPICQGLPDTKSPQITLKTYVELLEQLIGSSSKSKQSAKLRIWQEQVNSIKKRQRAFGPPDALKKWLAFRGMQMRELPLPQ